MPIRLESLTYGLKVEYANQSLTITRDFFRREGTHDRIGDRVYFRRRGLVVL